MKKMLHFSFLISIYLLSASSLLLADLEILNIQKYQNQGLSFEDWYAFWSELSDNSTGSEEFIEAYKKMVSEPYAIKLTLIGGQTILNITIVDYILLMAPIPENLEKDLISQLKDAGFKQTIPDDEIDLIKTLAFDASSDSSAMQQLVRKGLKWSFLSTTYKSEEEAERVMDELINGYISSYTDPEYASLTSQEMNPYGKSDLMIGHQILNISLLDYALLSAKDYADCDYITMNFNILINMLKRHDFEQSIKDADLDIVHALCQQRDTLGAYTELCAMGLVEKYC